jgi:hypothetical protein
MAPQAASPDIAEGGRTPPALTVLRRGRVFVLPRADDCASPARDIGPAIPFGFSWPSPFCRENARSDVLDSGGDTPAPIQSRQNRGKLDRLTRAPRELKDRRGYLIRGNTVEPKLKFPIEPLKTNPPHRWDFDNIVERIVLGPTHASSLALNSARHMLECLGKPNFAKKTLGVRNSLQVGHLAADWTMARKLAEYDGNEPNIYFGNCP